MQNSMNTPEGNFTKVPNKLLRDPNLSPNAKIIYAVIRSYSPSFPSYTRILKETGIKSRTTLSKELFELKIRRFIRVVDSPKHRSNLYEFPVQQTDSPSPLDEQATVQEMNSNKNNVKITSNNLEPPTAETVGDSLRKKILADAESLFSPDDKKRFRPKERPTLII